MRKSELVLSFGVLPLLIAGLVLGGVFLGFTVADRLDYGGTPFALLFSLGGFVLGVLLTVRLARKVAESSDKRR